MMAALVAASLLAPVAHPSSASESIPGSTAEVVAILNDDLLTLNSVGVPWATVVREFTSRTGIGLRIAPLPAGTVTASMSDVEIERGLRLLFGPDASFMFLYRPSSDPASPPALDEVWVRFPGAAASVVVVTARGGNSERDAPTATPARREVAQASRSEDTGTSSPTPTLDHRDPLVRQEALDAIVDRGDGSGVEEIRQVLLGDQDHEVRARAVTALGRISTAEALEALRPALTDSEITVRLTAVDIIASFETPRARALLRDALHDKDEQVRSVSAAALQALRDAGL